ncbi:MAG: HAD family hydrolase [Chloroflexota bacterium]
MTIQAITFDFWSTLYHFQQSPRIRQQQHIHEMLTHHGFQYDEQQVTKAMEQAWQIWDDIWRREHYTPEADAWLGYVINNLGVEIPKSSINQTALVLEKSVLHPTTQPVNGVSKTLQLLSKKYRLGIISDTGLGKGDVLRALLARDGLTPYFIHCIFSNEFGRSKPHRDVFQAALSELGAEPHQAVHIGDLRHTDIAGAHNAGMGTIRFAGIRDDREQGYPEADVVIYNYNEIEMALKELEIKLAGESQNGNSQ